MGWCRRLLATFAIKNSQCDRSAIKEEFAAIEVNFTFELDRVDVPTKSIGFASDLQFSFKQMIIPDSGFNEN
jgi:phage protein U